MSQQWKAPPWAAPLVALAFAFCAEHAHARTFLVGLGGSGNGCTHSSLSAAITAAANNPGPDDIRLIQGMTDAGQALVIRGQDLTITGGYENCGDPDVILERTVVSGLGGSAAPVFTIDGPGVVRLENLHIASGDSPGNGGGIAYTGSSRPGSVNALVLTRTVIDTNVAALDGGGVSFVASDFEPADLVLEQDTGLFRNAAARHGGGVYLAGKAKLTAEAHRLFFWDNVAQSGNGGALYLAPRASADIGSATWLGDATFLRNIAALDGGAIHMQADAGPNGERLRLYSILPDQPLTLAQNIGGRFGGALSVVGDATTGGSNAVICWRNVNVLNNAALDGGAAHVTLARILDCPLYEFPVSANIACTPRTLCGRFEGNRADEDTPGSAVFVVAQGQLGFYNATIKDNRAGSHLLRLDSGDVNSANASMQNTVVSGNVMALSGSAIASVGPGSTFAAVYTTMAGNSAARLIDEPIASPSGAIVMFSSILFHPLGEALVAVPEHTVLDHVLFDRRPAGHANNTTLIEGNPRFVNAQLQLAPDSPAVDVAPYFGELLTEDRRGGARPLDLGTHPNSSDGVADLGAFEVQFIEAGELFSDGFER